MPLIRCTRKLLTEMEAHVARRAGGARRAGAPARGEMGRSSIFPRTRKLLGEPEPGAPVARSAAWDCDETVAAHLGMGLTPRPHGAAPEGGLGTGHPARKNESTPTVPPRSRFSLGGRFSTLRGLQVPSCGRNLRAISPGLGPARSDRIQDLRSLVYSFSNPWLVNFSLRPFSSVTVRTTWSTAGGDIGLDLEGDGPPGRGLKLNIENPKSVGDASMIGTSRPPRRPRSRPFASSNQRAGSKPAAPKWLPVFRRTEVAVG